MVSFDECRSAKYARAGLALVAWRFSGWLLGCEMTSATTLYAAVVCKAQVTEVAQQHCEHLCQAGPFYFLPVNGFRGLELSNFVYMFCLCGLAVIANINCDLKC